MTTLNASVGRLAARLNLDSTYPTADGVRAYHVRGVPGGFGLMFVAGAVPDFSGSDRAR